MERSTKTAQFCPISANGGATPPLPSLRGNPPRCCRQGGPYHDLLHQLLGAYVCYRPDVGYIQGMSFIAAVLLLYTDGVDAFTCFANLLNRPFLFHFFQLDQSMVRAPASRGTVALANGKPDLGV